MPKTSSRGGPGAPPLAANVAELRALAHPLRLRILELFGEKPRTTKQVAEMLGQPPTRLYHHVAALERAGLLQLRETRKNRGATEKWYETPARMLSSGQSSARGAARAAQSRASRAAAMTVLEQSRQEMLQFMAQPTSGESPLVARIVMAVAPKQIPEIRQRLLDTIAHIRRDYDCDDTASPGDDDAVARWAVTMTFAPVAPASPARGKR